jgi:hypothetical protein
LPLNHFARFTPYVLRFTFYVSRPAFSNAHQGVMNGFLDGRFFVRNLFLVAPLFRREDFAGTGKSLRQRRRCRGVIDLVYPTKKIKTKQPANRQLKFINRNFFWHDRP